MKKMLHLVLVILVIFLVWTSPVFAKTMDQEIKASPSGSLNAFELFWPIGPGKTLDESLYFLKDFKEKFRGALIFGTPQKAKYAVLLATKRVLEAEKLIEKGKNDLANQTLDLAQAQFEMANKHIDMAKSKKEPLKESGGVIYTRLLNLEKYLTYLMTKQSSNKDKLQTVLSQVQVLLAKLK